MGLNGRKRDNESRERSQAKTGLNPASRRQHVPTGSAGTESPPDDQMTSILVPALPMPVESPSLWQPKLFPHISQRPQEHDWGPAETDKLRFFQAGGRQIHLYFRKPALVTRMKTGKWEAGNAAQEVVAGPGDRSPGLHWDQAVSR